MTTFFWVRHGTNDWVGRALAGDLEGVHLNAQGKQEAERLALRLASVPFAAIYSSPLDRTVETAQPLAGRTGLPVLRRPRLIEVGSGEWRGREFQELHGDPRWQRYNRFRSGTRGPGGELMSEIATRVVDEMEELRALHGGETVALFSHADVIKVAVAHYAGIPFDLMLRLEISPVSVSVIELHEDGPRILAVNATGAF